ncbi:PBP1A family penicillin-binding protein [Clostridium sp.]|uniref:transglycosylase domain-containing protein n=1 Tax=Clostridium sp. TaxID=1506 RepID=UPI002FCB2502
MGEKKQPEAKKKKPTKNKKSKFFKVLYISLLIIILSSIAVGGGIFMAMIKTAPKINLDSFLSVQETSVLYDNNQQKMDEYISEQRRIATTIDKVPESLKNAFISIEDERFKTHHGIDIKRLVGSQVENVKIITGLSSGSYSGASTITQQLVKYKFFLQESLDNRLSLKRKIQEMYLATEIEKKLSKDQILEAYMNTIFLGGDSHGIEAASNMYFNKSVSDLTLKQAAFLAGAAQNPSLSFSNAREAYDNKQAFDSPRTKAVLGKMLETGTINQAQYDEAIAEELLFSFSQVLIDKMQYEWFSRPVVEQVKKDLMTTYGYTEGEAYEHLNYGGLQIYTTMDRAMQDSTQKIIDESFPKHKDLQASAVIIDYVKGEVKAIVGGRGEQPALSYNRAASDQYLRAPGSSIKPLTVYAPAIDTKKLTAGSVLEDAPFPKDLGTKYAAPGEKPWTPNNWDFKFSGYITIRDAVKYSKNTIAAKVDDLIGLQTAVKYGEKFGIHLDSDDKSSLSAMSLGQLDGGEYRGTNPLAMAQAYGVFGNQGMMTKSRMYTKVTDKTGKVLLEPKFESTQVISAQAAYVMYDLLKEPVYGAGGTGTAAKIGNMPVRGKTGTSENYKDISFAGLTPYYSGYVWIGYDKPKELESDIRGSNNSASLWSKIMKEAHKDLPVKDIQKPDGLVTVSISKDSGTLPTELTKHDPRGNRIYSEIFINGTQPTTLDDIHVEAEVTKGPDGKYVLATEFTPKDKIEKRVFIKREHKYDAKLADDEFVLPTEKDSYKPADKPADPGTPGGSGDPNNPDKPEVPDDSESPDDTEEPGTTNPGTTTP